MAAKTGPQPLAAFTQPVRLDHPAPPNATYILCTQPGDFRDTADRARQVPGWRYRELATGHDAMVTLPHGLADLLLEIAALPEVAVPGQGPDR